MRPETGEVLLDTEANGVRRATRIDRFFGSDGPLAARLDAYEPRTQQVEMASAIEDALGAGRHLIVEAGTGVGKSFGYLVPTLLEALDSDRRVVVSTHTLSLQDQLIRKDIPLLADAMPAPFTAVVAKGRGNYLAPRRLHGAIDEAETYLDGRELLVELKRIRKWAESTEAGTLQDLIPAPDGDVWEMVQSEHGNCLGPRCEHHESGCFYHRERRRLATANLIVVNHSLFFADLALRENDVKLLPDYDIAVLDEAHTVEQVAVEHFGARVSRRMVQLLLSRLHNPRRGRGLLVGKPGADRALRLVEHARDASDRFFDRVAGFCGGVNETREIEEAGQIDNVLAPTLDALAHELGELRNKARGEEARVEMGAVRDRVEALSTASRRVVNPRGVDDVHWAEVGSKMQWVDVHAKPVVVADALRACLFEKVRSVILTSATLSVGGRGGLDWVGESLGAPHAHKLRLGSPFDYEEHVTLRIPSHLGEPRPGEEYEERLADSIAGYVQESGGGAFVLFTAHGIMRRIHERLLPWLKTSGFPTYLQGDGLPRAAMLERFKEHTNAVLFGTDSFWQGVDVPGEGLRLVIIAKLPFPVPTQPWHRARARRLQAQGRDPFNELSLPEAVIKFKQGFGRLVRTSTDRGTVVVLDARLLRKRYGRKFIEALPPVRVVED